MCACEGSFVCTQCEATPFSPYYEAEAYEPMSEPDFEALSAEPIGGRDWAGWV